MMRYLSMNAKYSALSERDQTYVIYANRHMENAEAAEGRKNPYNASFARGGESGLSFGWAQNDVHANREAKQVFSNILRKSGLFTDREMGEIIRLAKKPGVSERDFAPGTINKINSALNQNISDIDLLDRKRELDILRNVDNALVSIGSRGVFNKSHPDYHKAIAAMGHWSNQTGGLGRFTEHFSNMKKDPTFEDIDKYLQMQKYFRENKTPDYLHKNWLPRIYEAEKFANNKLEAISNLKLESLEEDKTREANNAVKLSDSDNVAAMSTKVELMSLPDNAPTIAISKIGILQKLESNNLNQQNDAESDNNITDRKSVV